MNQRELKEIDLHFAHNSYSGYIQKFIKNTQKLSSLNKICIKLQETDEYVDDSGDDDDGNLVV